MLHELGQRRVHFLYRAFPVPCVHLLWLILESLCFRKVVAKHGASTLHMRLRLCMRLRLYWNGVLVQVTYYKSTCARTCLLTYTYGSWSRRKGKVPPLEPPTASWLAVAPMHVTPRRSHLPANADPRRKLYPALHANMRPFSMA